MQRYRQDMSSGAENLDFTVLTFLAAIEDTEPVSHRGDPGGYTKSPEKS